MQAAKARQLPALSLRTADLPYNPLGGAEWGGAPEFLPSETDREKSCREWSNRFAIKAKEAAKSLYCS